MYKFRCSSQGAPLASEMLKTCGGLQLAISTLGKLLKNKAFDQWMGKGIFSIKINWQVPFCERNCGYNELLKFVLQFKTLFSLFYALPEHIPIKAETIEDENFEMIPMSSRRIAIHHWLWICLITSLCFLAKLHDEITEVFYFLSIRTSIIYHFSSTRKRYSILAYSSISLICKIIYLRMFLT